MKTSTQRTTVNVIGREGEEVSRTRGDSMALKPDISPRRGALTVRDGSS